MTDYLAWALLLAVAVIAFMFVERHDLKRKVRDYGTHIERLRGDRDYFKESRDEWIDKAVVARSDAKELRDRIAKALNP